MNNNNLFTYIFKYIIVGDCCVGKSCLLANFLNKEFKTTHDVTIGVDFGVKMLELQDKNIIKLYIWDTAGQESFKSIIRSYYRGAIGVLLIYDINNYESFNNIIEWIKEVKKYTIPEITFILIGNKSDLNLREVSYETGYTFAINNNLLFMETSAKLSLNVNTAFTLLTECIYNKINNNDIQITTNIQGIKIGTYKFQNNHIKKCLNC